MNEQKNQLYRQRLLTLAERLKGDLSGLEGAALRGTGGEASGGLSNAPLHMADLANDNFEQEVAIGLLQNEQHVLAAIAASLRRLESGEYGRCEQCGAEIPQERLQAIPYASRCVSCERQAENGAAD